MSPLLVHEVAVLASAKTGVDLPPRKRLGHLYGRPPGRVCVIRSARGERRFKLKDQAAKHRRSVAAELLTIVEEALEDAPMPPNRINAPSLPAANVAT